ncbi:hypothetical protein, partial [Flavobacterium sp.]|uniref:hypothetical protein n=1 Tax=Flavobacterium sp. TaxID=239 RepID=UPI004047ADF3
GESNYQGAGGGKLRNVLLENITINASFAEIGKQLIGESTASNIDGIKLKNIQTNEGVLTDFDQLNVDTNTFVTNIEIIK